MQREYKFSLLFQHEETGAICDKRYTLDELMNNSVSMYRWNLIAKREYTGIKDLNNREIYEGDIVKLIDREGEEIIFKIEFDCFGFMFDEISAFGIVCMMGEYDVENLQIEVIGNIYENPELLKY